MDSGVPKWQEESFNRFCNDRREESQRSRIEELEVENKKLRSLIHAAGHSFKDNWCINWGPIFDIMEEVDKENN